MVRTLENNGFYTPKPCFDEWPDGQAHWITMVVYTPNLVLTSGLMVRTLNAMVLYTPNLVLMSGLMVRTLDAMVLYTPNLVFRVAHQVHSWIQGLGCTPEPLHPVCEPTGHSSKQGLHTR